MTERYELGAAKKAITPLKFSHQKPLLRVRVTRAAAVMVVMAVGLRVRCLRVLNCLVRALAFSTGARMGVISPPAPSGVGVGVRVLGRDLDTDAGPGVAVVADM